MPRVLIGSIADKRVVISFAALLVNVTARMPEGEAWPLLIRYAMRVVSTRVLPLPAPARISADWCGSVTAWRCSGLRPESRWEFIGELSHRMATRRFALKPRGQARLFVEQYSRSGVVYSGGANSHSGQI